MPITPVTCAAASSVLALAGTVALVPDARVAAATLFCLAFAASLTAIVVAFRDRAAWQRRMLDRYGIDVRKIR